MLELYLQLQLATAPVCTPLSYLIAETCTMWWCDTSTFPAQCRDIPVPCPPKEEEKKTT